MATSFENVRNQCCARGAERGGKDRSKLFRNLDPRQRRALTLFETSREITGRDVAALFGFKSRNAALLCQRWVKQGFTRNNRSRQKIATLQTERHVYPDCR